MLLSTYQAADLPADAARLRRGRRTCNKEEFGPQVVHDLWARRTPS